MAGGVHEVELIILAVFGFPGKADGLGLDGDAALALDVHVVEDLFLHFARLQPAAGLNQAVGQGRFPMVDMGDNREVADAVDGFVHGAYE